MTRETCTGCGARFERPTNRKRLTRVFCTIKCYGRWQRGQSFVEQGKPTRPTRRCSQRGCLSVHFGRGLCRRHYLRRYYPPSKRRNSPSAVRLECLNCGKLFSVPQFRASVAKFCTRFCACRFNRTGKIVKKGYRKVLRPEHSRADGKGYVFEHVLVMEGILGRAIARGEEVHHVDGNRLNNSAANLRLFADHGSHMKVHARPLCAKE